MTGCSQSSDVNKSIPPKQQFEPHEQDEVGKLIDEYQQLPIEKQNALAGDKLVMQVESLLKMNPSPAQLRAESVVREHNKEMVKRALQDPDLVEVIGTEVAPPPRER
jgi:hypothetical protein